VGVSDYITGSKSVIFFVSSQRHIKLVFDSSYILYFCHKSIVKFVLNYYFRKYECTQNAKSKDIEK